MARQLLASSLGPTLDSVEEDQLSCTRVRKVLAKDSAKAFSMECIWAHPEAEAFQKPSPDSAVQPHGLVLDAFCDVDAGERKVTVETQTSPIAEVENQSIASWQVAHDSAPDDDASPTVTTEAIVTPEASHESDSDLMDDQEVDYYWSWDTEAQRLSHTDEDGEKVYFPDVFD
ncbi:Uu.00g128580.m01.CDS01 [Anthostomella pinea]|uniref:Uu.00g128580.m01.CDS01 n=1 Tax=Anthostomella pinea TaxID=933095 RepID=A0AAI8VIB8_9PEZI|nr:Uu.00g128580.m01.CDS01 [Anthostomella pinea]